MRFGPRRPSFRKRIAARTSWKRYVRHSLGVKAPRVPDFYELCEYWNTHPPTHLMVAAYLRIGESKPEPKGDLGELRHDGARRCYRGTGRVRCGEH